MGQNGRYWPCNRNLFHCIMFRSVQDRHPHTHIAPGSSPTRGLTELTPVAQEAIWRKRISERGSINPLSIAGPAQNAHRSRRHQRTRAQQTPLFRSWVAEAGRTTTEIGTTTTNSAVETLPTRCPVHGSGARGEMPRHESGNAWDCHAICCGDQSRSAAALMFVSAGDSGSTMRWVLTVSTSARMLRSPAAISASIRSARAVRYTPAR